MLQLINTYLNGLHLWVNEDSFNQAYFPSSPHRGVVGVVFPPSHWGGKKMSKHDCQKNACVGGYY